jgi:hypothetical protein
MSKLGVLWLVDLVDGVTIKVLTVHGSAIYETAQNISNKVITKALILDGPSPQHPKTLITGSIDGTVKQTSLINLEQTHEIYKPRRTVTDILVANDMVIVGFDIEIYFYSVVGGGEEWKFIGSINLQELSINTNPKTQPHKSALISLKPFPAITAYLACTPTNLFLLHHQPLSPVPSALKLEVKHITGELDHAMALDVKGGTHVMVRSDDKVCVWTQKEKRGEENIFSGFGCKLDDIVYWMSDVYQIVASDCWFVQGNGRTINKNDGNPH